MAKNGLLRRRPADRDAVEDTEDLANHRVAAPYEQTQTDIWPGETWPGGLWPAEDSLAPPRRWVRVSAWAAVGPIVSLVGLGMTLSGLLAPEGLALGAVGILASVIGFVGASRPGITGHSLAILGLLAGAAGNADRGRSDGHG